MERKRTGPTPKPKALLNLLLEADELERLDALVECFNVSRKDVLMRGLFVLDVTHMLAAAPTGASIMVGVTSPPADGARFSERVQRDY